MDTFSEDLIGSILSRLGSARSLASASATCRKWHEIAMHHLEKITFIESDFPSRQVGCNVVPGAEEIIVSNLVMRTSCLRELSINAGSNVTFQAAPVIEWLIHTKKTLKYLDFMNCTSPRLNILEHLGGDLEELAWNFAYIPEVNPAVYCFQSLSLLFLKAPYRLTSRNLEALLLACPKLKILTLTQAAMWPDVGAPEHRTLELVSTSLKSLTIKGGLMGIDNLVLHMDCLVILSLHGLTLKLLKLVHTTGRNALHLLRVGYTEATQVQFDGAASALRTLIISGRSDFAAECAIYQEVMSRARNLTELGLSGLSGTYTRRRTIDLRMIASSFPSLQCLAIDCDELALDTFASQGSIEAPFLKELVELGLVCARIHEGFAQWIAEFLDRFSSLRHLRMRVYDIKGTD